ncbi:MAG: hypothetical protein G01um101433_1042 [Parcubacteria group bacterium Gr01-1014_33]|nr:MAG: hypothetical protein G01um101433_1042 [Parcubacteria group bacterium Gr01-1014_33]
MIIQIEKTKALWITTAMRVLHFYDAYAIYDYRERSSYILSKCKSMMDELKKRKIIDAVTQRGVSPKEAAKKLYVSEGQLRLLFESWGVPLRKKRIKQDVPARESLLKLYRQYGTTVKLAEHFNVGINTANRWLKERKVPARKMKMSPENKIRFLEEHLSELDNFNL